MYTYILNLVRRRDRRERMEERLRAASISKWSFVEGLDSQELSMSPDGTLTSSNLYCAWVSHTWAMRQIQDGGDDFALVLEDDAVLSNRTHWPQTLSAIEDFMTRESMEYLQIGHISAAYPQRILSKTIKGWIFRSKEADTLPLPELANSVLLGQSRAGAHAYVISRRLAGLVPAYNIPTWVGPDGFFDRLASATFAEGSLRMGTLRHSLVEQESREFVGSTIDSDNFT